MSTATKIKYNEKGQNNIYPDDYAASFVDGSLKSNSTELPFTQNVDLSQINDPDFVYEDGRLKQKNQYGDSDIVCVWTQNPTENFTRFANPFITNNATIINGAASMQNGIVRFADEFFRGKDQLFFEADFVIDEMPTGTKEIFWCRGSISRSAGNYIRVQYENGERLRFLVTAQGVQKSLDYILPNVAVGKEYKIAFDFKNATTSENGYLAVYVDGVPLPFLVLNDRVLSETFSNMFFSSQNKIFLKNFQFQDSVKYAGQSYIPRENLPQKPYAESSVTVLLKSFDRNINQISSFNFTGSTNVRFTAQDQRFANTSQTWVPSLMNYSQSTVMSIAQANISKLEMNTPDIKVDLHFPPSNIQEFVEFIDFELEMNYFVPVVNLTTMGTSIFATRLFGFEYKAFDEEGCFMFVWLIADGEWFWRNPATEAWEISDKSFEQSNSLAYQAQHIASFPFNNAIKKIDHSITLYLPIDPVTGFQSLQSPSVEWVSYEYGQHNVELPPPHETTLTGMIRNVGTNPSANYLRVSRNKTMIYPSTIVHPDKWDIYPDPAVGSISKGLYETESIGECYKFEQSYTVIDKRTNGEKVKFDLLGFSVYPLQDKIRPYDLPLAPTEDEAKIRYAVWLAAGKPQPIPPELFSYCQTSNVSGDCLIEYVNDLLQNGGSAVAGTFRGEVDGQTQMRSVPQLEDGDYVASTATETIWSYSLSDDTWTDTGKAFAVSQSVSEAPSDRAFRGFLPNLQAILALEILSDTDYAHNADTETIWRYDAATQTWFDTNKPIDISSLTVAKVNFENVDTVVASYAQYIDRPIAEIWILEDNGISYAKAQADIDYDTVNKTLTVNFNGSLESGFLILK